MTNTILLPCDGCGQLADAEHIAQRLQRLEWATRFRPVHIQTLLLGGVSPHADDEYLYNPQASVLGVARIILDAAQIPAEGKPKETLLADFQKLGLLLTHILECPLEPLVSESEARSLLHKHLPAAAARIRRSLKPKRVLLLSAQLEQFADELRRTDLGCPIFPAPKGTFLSSKVLGEGDFRAFRVALAGSLG